MKSKCKILLIIASLALTLSLMSNTYSRYVANTTGNVDIAFANWQILVNDNDILAQNTSSIEITPTILENKNIKENTIAPSSKGYFDIEIDPSNVGVSFNYQINLAVLNENIPDLLITKYAILDETYTETDEIVYQDLNDNVIKEELAYQENTTFKPFTVRIYFEWFDEANETMTDEMDSEVGHDAALNNTTLQIEASIQFEQSFTNQI